MRPFSHFSLSYNLTSDDLWPWYMTFDLINKWGFPCCIYDPTLVEIHQSMWKIQPNVNHFFTTNNSNIGQQWTKWSIWLCVFPATGRWQKKKKNMYDLLYGGTATRSGPKWGFFIHELKKLVKSLRGTVLHLACFVLYLKLISTSLKNNMYPTANCPRNSMTLKFY